MTNTESRIMREVDDLCNALDPAGIDIVCAIVADAQGISIPALLESPLGIALLEGTQGVADQSHRILLRLDELNRS